ncbi:MAG: hypothetical protein ACQES5_04945 [Thermodesulfobacteriota bacterium]
MRASIKLTFLMAFLFLFSGCAIKKSPDILPEEARLAVAGFFQPKHSWQLLAGYVREDRQPVPGNVLADLDNSLANSLIKYGREDYVRPPFVRQCREIILQETGRSRVSALKYWIRVGQCIPADFILVPTILEMHARKGGEWGVKEPAAVVMDIYLIDVQNERMRRYHFDEVQKSISENILEAKKIIRRSGKWLTAKQLAMDGIEQGVVELGL